MKTPNPVSGARLAPLCLAIATFTAACGGSTQTIDANEDGGTEVVTETTTTTAADDDPTAEAVPQLAEAKSTWGGLGLENYSYTFTRACECPEDQQGPFRVIVIDGLVDRVEWFGSEVDEPGRTVPDLYAAMEDAVGRGLEVSATFDELTGHPVEVLLDLEALAVDGGEAITVTSFSSADLLLADLESARADWHDAGITDYELTYQVQCFCPETIRRVTVRNGDVVEVVDLAEEFDGWPGLTIDDLFETLAEAIAAPAFSIDVSYDEKFGFPSSYFIDEEQNMADEEHGIVVTDFTPLS